MKQCAKWIDHVYFAGWEICTFMVKCLLLSAISVMDRNRFCVKLGKSVTEALSRLWWAYRDEATGCTQCFEWHKGLKRHSRSTVQSRACSSFPFSISTILCIENSSPTASRGQIVIWGFLQWHFETSVKEDSVKVTRPVKGKALVSSQQQFTPSLGSPQIYPLQTSTPSSNMKTRVKGRHFNSIVKIKSELQKDLHPLTENTIQVGFQKRPEPPRPVCCCCCCSTRGLFLRGQC